MYEFPPPPAPPGGWTPPFGAGPLPAWVGATNVVVWAAAAAVPCVMLWAARGHPCAARRLLSLLAVCAAGTAMAHVLRDLPAAASDSAVGAVLASAAVAASVGAVALLLRRLDPAVAAVWQDAEVEHERLVLLEAAVAASGDGVMIAAAAAADSPGVRIVYANPAFERMMGYAADEAVGLSPSVLCHLGPDDGRAADHPAAGAAFAGGDTGLQAVRTALRGSAPVRLEVAGRRKDGSRMWAEWQVVPVTDPAGHFTHSVAVIRDTTERRRLEDQLREAQKMDAIGRLAGGVAHDFNNLLTVIRGNAELLRDAGPEVREVPELVDEIRGAAERGAGLVRQLLTFGRRQPEKPVVLDLNAVVTETAGILRRLLGERVAVAAHLSPRPVAARLDRGQLEQVIMNLAVNARDAMPRGGTLTISTAAAAGATGRTARLTVSDTGVGMSEAVRARIFEPFFTTKDVGKGTGLGLATVYGIVTQSGGRIEVESAAGAGTTFRVDLPWCDEPLPPPSASAVTPPSRERPAPAPAPAPAGRRLLLVEDEEGVRKLARFALSAGGYHVIEAVDGEAALELLATAPPVELVITDLTMPGMGGRELVARVRAGWPDVAVVFVSGYASDMALLESVPGALFVAKPFSPADLVKAADRAVGRAARVAVPV